MSINAKPANTPVEITDFPKYLSEMHKSSADKLWFLDKIPPSSIFDFGCADGTLLFLMEKLYPHNQYYGYDCNPSMISRISKDAESKVFLTSDFQIFRWLGVTSPHPKCLNLSSVIHEIYSYNTQEQIDSFWKYIYSSDFTYIAIRDMGMSEADMNETSPLATTVRNLCVDDMKERLDDFESVFGNIDEQQNLTHFLLKYRYKENWSREVHENYLPVSVEKLLSTIPDSYEVVCFEHFLLPFIHNKIQEDFGVDFNINTHYKILLHKKNDSKGKSK